MDDDDLPPTPSVVEMDTAEEIDMCALGDDDMEVDSVPGYHRMDATVDSGAGKPVMNPKHAPGYTVYASAGSKAGQNFVGPSGEKIPNEGELKVGIKLESGADRRASFDAADVRKTLLAVSGLCDKEQFVFFDNEGPFICPPELPRGCADQGPPQEDEVQDQALPT
jgi:hypothetical protein